MGQLRTRRSLTRIDLELTCDSCGAKAHYHKSVPILKSVRDKTLIPLNVYQELIRRAKRGGLIYLTPLVFSGKLVLG